jgi:hypothetical protein
VRVYRGFCLHDETLDQAIDVARSTRSTVTAAILDHPLLRERAKKNSFKFVNEFYEILENPKKVQKLIRDSCRDWNS